MNRLIKSIQRQVISDRWTTGEGAQFEYNTQNNSYRLIHFTPDLQNYMVGPTQRSDKNSPIVAKGFVANLIRNWGKSEQLIFDNYYENRLNNFKRIESRNPGSSMRNLDAEFYPLHVTQEKEFVTFSEKIHPYLSKSDIELINQYIEAYFKYIEQVFAPRKITKNILSVPDWCIVFYYLDEAGKKEGNKIDRMKKFIEDNNVVNPSGELTTPKNFRKEYYEIENRINGKNDKKPLPPVKIENILPYLKNNEKAMQNAVSDTGYLADEIEENKRNTH